MPQTGLLPCDVGEDRPSGARKLASRLPSRLPSCWIEGGKADRERGRKCGRVGVRELVWAAPGGLLGPRWASVLSRARGERPA